MNSINEVIPLLLPVMDALLSLSEKNPRLEPLAHSVHDMQLAIYWLKTAEKGLDNQQGELLEGKENQTIQPVRPTLIGNADSFNYVSKQLKSVTSDLYSFKEQMPFGYAKEHTDEGYKKLMEAYFNVQIGQMYYNELSRR